MSLNFNQTEEMSDQDPAYDWAREHLNKESAKMGNTVSKKSDSWIFYIVGGVILALIILWVLAIILTKPKKKTPPGGAVEDANDEYADSIHEVPADEGGVPVASGDE